MPERISELIEIAGKIVEGIGVAYAGNKIFDTQKLFQVFISALWRGEKAKEAIETVNHFGREDYIYALQGISFVMLGIMIQVIPYLFDLTQYVLISI